MTDTITKYEQEADDLTDAVGPLVLKTDEDFHLAAETLRSVKASLNAMEQERLSITRPMREAMEKTNSLFKRVAEKYLALETSLKQRIADFDQRKKAEETRLLAEAAENQTAIVLQAAPVAQGVSVREIVDFEVVDPSLVPREFLMVDEKLIRATVKAKKGKVEIPGVRIFKKPSVAAKGAQ